MFCLINKCLNMSEYEPMYTPLLNFLKTLQEPQSSLSMFNTGAVLIKFFTHEELYISFMFVSFTLIDGNFLYNSCLFMYFPIPVVEIITASGKHDLRFEWLSFLWYWDPSRQIYSVDFIFLPNFCLDFSYFYPTFYLFNCNDYFHIEKLLLMLWEKFFWVHTCTVVIDILSPECWIYILVINLIPMKN